MLCAKMPTIVTIASSTLTMQSLLLFGQLQRVANAEKLQFSAFPDLTVAQLLFAIYYNLPLNVFFVVGRMDFYCILMLLKN